MLARTAKPVVKIEMAERGVHVVPPQQADHTAAEPDAFRVAGRPANQTGSFGKLVCPALRILCGVGSLGWGCFVAALRLTTLGKSRH